MGRQRSWLVLLLVAMFCATQIASLSSSIPANDIHENENKIENIELKTKAKSDDLVPLKIQTKKMKNAIGNELKKVTISTPKTGEHLVTGKKDTTKIPLAEDPRYNKMLPESNILKDEKDSKNTDETDDYSYDYDEDYSYDESASTESNKTSAASSTEKPKLIGKLKPIKGDDKSIPKQKSSDESGKESDNTDEDDDDDDDDDNGDDEYDDDIADEEEIVFNENVPCPRDCICARNLNSYLVATCSRLDADIQKFGSDITDLVVVDIGPKYPIILGPEFFVKIGLKHISSIKINNCTIEYIHPTAFHGLDELYSVNLTNVGLTLIKPDTFVENKKLRMLTISGNDLSAMSRLHYILKSASIEEFDLSRNNLQELNSTAFNQLSNIVYINLSQNNLKKLPQGLFDSVETIEELDLSYNSLSVLPPNIFNRTALAILHLQYNDFSSDLRFGTSDLQQLDLSYCSIKQVHHGMFDKMEGLSSLNLKGNGITKIQPDSFLSLKNLKHIDLSINDLDQVSSLLFFKNTELDVIRLSGNPRLSQLPNDGFQSVTGDFTVYLFDVSNCAIGALGHKTFSTMPHLTTLKLAWNNINNLDKSTFNALDKLTELDLSNNLIMKLDELTFLHNHDITKLNLAGNPIRKLSAKLFLPMAKLTELDVSECELHVLLNDIAGIDHKYKFFETLRTFNASFNQIKKITKEDVQFFKNLKTLDIGNNPIKCNDDFKGLMKYLTRKSVVTGKVSTNANLDDSFGSSGQRMQGWDEFARAVCKHSVDTFKPKERTIEQIRQDILKGDKIDIEKLIFEQEDGAKFDSKLLDSANKKKNVEDGKKLKVDESKENAKDVEAEEDSDDDDNYNYDYDEDDKEDAADEIDLSSNKPEIKDKGLFAEEVNIVKETRDKFLLGKLLSDDETENELDDDDDDDDDDSEEIIIERGRIYYNGYRFLIPMVIIITCIIVLLLAIGKVISLMMRKRGERYRMALLASKNSIVYQKLSEEIAPSKQPKVHRYAPVAQV